MKSSGLFLAALLFCALSLGSCSSPKPIPQRQPGALGDITKDQCIFYCEGEDFSEKSGGNIDLKAGAYNGKCLGDRWGEKPTDFVTYDVELKETSASTLLVIRAAIDGTQPQSYDVLIDGKTVQRATLTPTGGYGYTENQWNCFSIRLGQIMKGAHTLTIKPVNPGLIVNIDCLALGNAG